VVHSAFHFHYSLQLANDPAAFFEREISYRKWFRLPPLCAVYQLDFRHRDLRTLAS
jgi:primosomal protein N'